MLPGGSLVLNVRGGVRLCVPATRDEATTYILVEQEDWMEDEIGFVRGWLKPGMRAVDVGANHGVYTAAMARAVGPAGRVWAFEPTPDVAARLKATLELNGFSNTTLIPAAVSDTPGTLLLATGQGSELNQVARAGHAGGCVEVPAVTLDAMAAQYGWGSVDFIKIDIEGHEPQAIAGGKALLAAGAPLVMLEIFSGGEAVSAAPRSLEALGYSLYRLVPGPMLLAPFDASRRFDAFQMNAFACKPERAAAMAAEGVLALPDAAAKRKPPPSAWADYSQRAPYARRLAPQWHGKPAVFSGGGQRAYYDGLVCYGAARAVDADAAQRLAWLQQAYDHVQESLRGASTLARLVSLARITADLGLRAEANEALRGSINRAYQDAASAEAEPFLAPSARAEQIEAGLPLFDWLNCMLREQREKQRAFSSFYGGEDTNALLESVYASPYCSPESERRRQLLAMLERRQAAPQPHRLLREPSPDNLNPAYWAGA